MNIQIRLLEEQSDQGLHWLLFQLHILIVILHCIVKLLHFRTIMVIIFGVPIFVSFFFAVRFVINHFSYFFQGYDHSVLENACFFIVFCLLHDNIKVLKKN